MAENRNSSKFGIGVILGAIAGALAGLFLSPKSGKETREELVKKWQELKKEIRTGELQKKALDIFGDAKEQSIKLYQEAKDDLLRRMDNFKEAIGEINKEKYQKTVNEVIDDLKDAGKTSADSLKKLGDYFMNDWDRIMKKPTKH